MVRGETVENVIQRHSQVSKLAAGERGGEGIGFGASYDFTLGKVW